MSLIMIGKDYRENLYFKAVKQGLGQLCSRMSANASNQTFFAERSSSGHEIST